MIKINKNMSIEVRNRAIDFALFFGFKSESAIFPIVSFDEGVEVPTTYEGFSDIFECGKYGVKSPEGYIPATDSAVELWDFDWRKNKGLESIFTN